ncbi:hypothetical protein [Pseudomonas aeruginosa]|nr:hypothetical protein [Pseudomonas aeruginosa]
MVLKASHGIEALNAIHDAMEKRCLAIPKIASQCRMKSQESPQ